ncbi:uncharacterized protein LOC106160117 [Lingula anatina]|uniref:Uncharacterized protein LOC106160117 n=1 Tax=Lingula anatina TaxID=7574 RepID=A0A1S3I1F4_LINAN|nr:uncharacterized protein LOC106160117 [Lingula anatina]|eukprot:XP_013392090.1 uncharacterized protein LOC106160117 [Lingula anatina]
MKDISFLVAIVCIVPILVLVALVETSLPCQPSPIASFDPEGVEGTWYGTNIYWPNLTMEFWQDYANTFTLHPNGNMTWQFDLRWSFTNVSECTGWSRELVPDPNFNGKYDWFLNGSHYDSLYFAFTDYNDLTFTYQMAPESDWVRMLTVFSRTPWNTKTILTKYVLIRYFCVTAEDVAAHLWNVTHENPCIA